MTDTSLILQTPTGILAGVKEGGAFTAGEWGASFSGRRMEGSVAVLGSIVLDLTLIGVVVSLSL